MPRVGLSTGAVVDAALALVDAEGPAALTLATVADRTGVATPSLYKHVRSLSELRRLVAVRVMNQMGDALGEAVQGRGGAQAVTELMLAYHRFATGHPHRYAVIAQAPQTDPEMDVAGNRIVQTIFAVLHGYGLVEADAVHAARCIRSAAHGFASLQGLDAFGLAEQLTDTHRHLIRLFTDALPTWPQSTPHA